MKLIKVKEYTDIIGRGSGNRYVAKAGGLVPVDDRDLPQFQDELSSLNLPERVTESLRDAGVGTVTLILEHPDLTEIPGIGKKTAANILESVNDN